MCQPSRLLHHTSGYGARDEVAVNLAPKGGSMGNEHAHQCQYQAVATSMARTIANEIARILPPTDHEGRKIAAVISPQGLPATLSVAQAAEVIGIGRSSVYEAVRTEEIPSIRIGNRIKIPTGRLFEYLATGRPWREVLADLRTP
jgi:excisionase family DNA binding protein